MRHLRAQRDNPSNRTKVEQHNSQKAIQKTLCRGSLKNIKKCRLESQNASQNRPRRLGRAPGPPPSRDFRQKNFHFWLLPGSKNVNAYLRTLGRPSWGRSRESRGVGGCPKAPGSLGYQGPTVPGSHGPKVPWVPRSHGPLPIRAKGQGLYGP